MITSDDLRALALVLPEVKERETWGEVTFRVRAKIFIIMRTDGVTASIKASLDDQAALIALDPVTFAVAPYTGRYGWVSVQLSTADSDMVGEVVQAAWRRTAPKRLAATLPAPPPALPP